MLNSLDAQLIWLLDAKFYRCLTNCEWIKVPFGDAESWFNLIWMWNTRNYVCYIFYRSETSVRPCQKIVLKGYESDVIMTLGTPGSRKITTIHSNTKLLTIFYMVLCFALEQLKRLNFSLLVPHVIQLYIFPPTDNLPHFKDLHYIIFKNISLGENW